jgi:hypothetical protein
MANTLSLGSGNWGAKESLLLGYYEDGTQFLPETFDVTRATGGTRVNKAGLIETPADRGSELVTNGDFSNGLTDWIAKDGTMSLSGSGSLLFDNNSGNSSGGAFQNLSLVTGKQYQMTATMQLLTGISNGSFNLFTSTAAGTGQSTVYNGGPLTPGGGAVTETFTFTPAAGDVSIQLYCDESNATYTIDNISVKEYNDKNLARIDYLDDAKGALLTEPQSTNVVAQSANLSRNYWSASQEVSLVGEQSSPSADSPLGAYDVIESTSDSVHKLRSIIFTTAAVESTMSVYIKYSTKRFIEFRENTTNARCKFDLLNNVVTQSIGAVGKIEDAGNGFKRISITYTANGTTSRVQLGLLDDSAGSNYPGNGTDKITVFGFQVEQANSAGYDGKYATSYIPTIGQIQSRAADLVTNGGDVKNFNSEEGVLYAEIAALEDDLTYRGISLNDGTNANSLCIRYRPNSNRVNAIIKHGSGANFQLSFDISDITQFNKIALKYKSGDTSMYINGTEVVTSSLPFSFTSALNDLSFNRGDSGDKFFGKTKNVQVFNEALTDSELVALTTI